MYMYIIGYMCTIYRYQVHMYQPRQGLCTAGARHFAECKKSCSNLIHMYTYVKFMELLIIKKKNIILCTGTRIYFLLLRHKCMLPPNNTQNYCCALSNTPNIASTHICAVFPSKHIHKKVRLGRFNVHLSLVLISTFMFLWYAISPLTTN